VANWIADLLDDINNNNNILEIKQTVLELCKEFPVYATNANLWE